MDEIINGFSDLIQIGTEIVNNRPLTESLPNDSSNNQIPIAITIFINNQSHAVMGVPVLVEQSIQQVPESASVNPQTESTVVFSQNLLNQESDFERLRRSSRITHSRRIHQTHRTH